MTASTAAGSVGSAPSLRPVGAAPANDALRWSATAVHHVVLVGAPRSGGASTANKAGAGEREMGFVSNGGVCSLGDDNAERRQHGLEPSIPIGA
jgi:hypothetical protein